MRAESSGEFEIIIKRLRHRLLAYRVLTIVLLIGGAVLYYQGLQTISELRSELADTE